MSERETPGQGEGNGARRGLPRDPDQSRNHAREDREQGSRVVNEPGASFSAGAGGEASPGARASLERLAPTSEDIAQEAARARRLQRAVDVSLAYIYQSRDLSLGDSIEIALELRRIALLLFPGSEQTFDMLYRPRLMRAIRERFGIDEAPEAEIDPNHDDR